MDLESSFIDYLEIPSLQQLACIKISSLLWMHPNLRNMLNEEYLAEIFKLQNFSDNEQVALLHERANNNLLLLPLPEHLKDLVSNFLTLVGKQLILWVSINKVENLLEKDNQDFRSFFHSSAKINSINWTSDGIIHKAKTYEAILNNANSDDLNYTYFGKGFLNIFETLCDCCLEDYIFKFWHLIPKEIRDHSFENAYNQECTHFLAYWLYILKKDQFDFLEKISESYSEPIYDSKHSVYRNMVSLSVRTKNVYAFRYFWKKLTREEIESSVTAWVEEGAKRTVQIEEFRQTFATDVFQEKYSKYNILLFLLSQITPEKQKAVINTYRDKILLTLISNYSWRQLYLRTMDLVINSIDSNDWCELVHILLRYKDEMKLVNDVIQRSPVHFYKTFIAYLISEENGDDLLWKIFTALGIETANLFLIHANAEEKKRIIFAFIGNEGGSHERIWSGRKECLKKEKFDSIDQLLLCMELDEEDCGRFRHEMVKRYLNDLGCHWILTSNWNAIDNFLNWGCSGQQTLIQDSKKNMNKDRIISAFIGLKKIKRIDKFVHWCFSSDEDILDFKRNCAYSENPIISILTPLTRWNKISSDMWNDFQEYLFWCLPSDEEVEKLKTFLTRSLQLTHVVFDLTVNRNAFDLCDQLLMWCFKTDEAVTMFKRSFLSTFREELFEDNYYAIELLGRDKDNYEYLRNLSKWLDPVSKEIPEEYKKRIENAMEIANLQKCK